MATSKQERQKREEQIDRLLDDNDSQLQKFLVKIEEGKKIPHTHKTKMKMQALVEENKASA